MRALERNGLVKTLAEPNLTAISGESAKFLAGGEYPVPVVDTDGGIAVSFKEFGVGVAFTPTVLSEGRISLKIETEVSELTNVGGLALSDDLDPGTEEASGQVDGRAAFGRIARSCRPHLGGHAPEHRRLPRPQGPADPRHAVPQPRLHQERDRARRDRDALPGPATSRKDLGRPLDGLADPSDMKANFLGHLNRIYGKGSAVPAGDLKGDYGFIVE